MRRPLVILPLLAVAVALAIGLVQSGRPGAQPAAREGQVYPSLDGALARLRGSPPALAALHRQASQLLPGGERAIRARLRALRGHPVVLNKWASWCGPCRYEFPFFQAQAAAQGKRVAFLGLDSGDAASDARDFLRRFPVTYPSYADPRERAARALGTGSYFPVTMFIDARGRTRYIHPGGYASEAALRRDLERYLGV
jgi:thiol-disulfide isomerase/thioredoxin